jgi:hypothetical protein
MSINMSKKKKKVAVIIEVIICLCLVFIGVFYVSNNKDDNSKVVIGQTKNDIVKDGIKNIEDIINSDSAFTEDDLNIIEQFIDKYKDEDLVKNDLTNFIIEKAEEYLKSNNQNNDLYYKINCSLDKLYIDYPNNKKVIALRDDFNNSTVTKDGEINIPTKLTSSDGMLELENSSSSKQYVIGTIKNLSSESYRYVEVNINLYDSENNQVNSTMANINNLEPNGTWNFKAVIINQKEVSRYKIVSIEGIR